MELEVELEVELELELEVELARTRRRSWRVPPRSRLGPPRDAARDGATTAPPSDQHAVPTEES